MGTVEPTLSSRNVDDLLEQHLGETAPRGVPRVPPGRPVHVVYGGAHLYRAGTARKLGDLALAAMDAWAKDATTFGAALGIEDGALAADVAARVRTKLATEPVEAYCIDFEDGFGPRPDPEEDAEAVRAATELAKSPLAPRPVVGMRVKAMAGASRRRAARTLDLFVTTLAKEAGPGLRDGFSVTLPKVMRPAEVTALVALLDRLEDALGVSPGTIRVELMLESPRALFAEDGRLALPALTSAARGRCVAVHLGAYDLTASLGVTATDQRLDHPVCDFARVVAQLALAGTGVAVSDGATTVLPIAPDGADVATRARAVHDAWKLHAANVRRALDVGIFQGWDLHPAQLPARYGALYASFRGERVAFAARLRSFVERAAKASRVGQVFDDAATAEGLVAFFLRGLACGALDEDDVAATTLTVSELEGDPFAARAPGPRGEEAP